MEAGEFDPLRLESLRAFARMVSSDPWFDPVPEAEDPAEEAHYRQFLGRFLAESYVALKEPLAEDLIDAIDIDEQDFARFSQDTDAFAPAIVTALRNAYLDRFEDNAAFHQQAVVFLAELVLHWLKVTQRLHGTVTDQAAEIVQGEQRTHALVDEMKTDPSVLIDKLEQVFEADTVSDEMAHDLYEAQHKQLYDVIADWLTKDRLASIVAAAASETMIDEEDALEAEHGDTELESVETERLMRLNSEDAALLDSVLNLTILRGELGLKEGFRPDYTPEDINRLKALREQLSALDQSVDATEGTYGQTEVTE